MPLDLLLVTALIVAVVMIAVMMVRLRKPLRISLTVRAGRQVTVGGTPFPADGPSSRPQSFSVPLDLVSMTDDEVVLSIDSHTGTTSQSVSMSRKGLRTLQIDASLESTLVVYGGYDPPAKRRTQSSAESPTQTMAESPTQSMADSPTQSTAESPTQSSAESPTQTTTRSMAMTQEAVAWPGGGRCIQCKGGIIICGINPVCR